MNIMKYGPLVSGVIIIFFVPYIIFTNESEWPDIVILLLIAFLIELLFLTLFIKYTYKLKYVAIGKMKLVVEMEGKEVEYSWLDVEQISLNRFWRLYRLKLKGEDEIYFTPYGLVTLLTGDESDMGVIINKMKRELSI